MNKTTDQKQAMTDPQSPPRLAWSVEIDTMNAIVFAETAPKARWIAVKAYREAGYGLRGSWPSCCARRCERHDNSVLRDRPQQAWTPSYVEDMR